MSEEMTAPVLTHQSGFNALRTGASPVRVVPRWWRDASIVGLWAILMFVIALWVSNGALAQFTSPADAFTALGRLAGLIASALLLVQVFLMARVPWIEKAWGQDELTRLHRIVGFTSFTLLLGHVVLIVIGYASARPERVWSTIVDLTLNYPGMLLGVAGFGALCMIVVTSYRAARRLLRYESWHLIHLYAYLGTGLALPHQLWTGQDFLASPVSTVFWWTLYAVCLAAVVVFRLGLPLWQSTRGALRVLDVRAEGPDATTVTVGGPGVKRLGAQGGQFFQWRFLDGPGWTRAHPYSLSAAPSSSTLRFTAARVGDGTTALSTLRPGTRVLVEGPYGRMHPGTRTNQRVLLAGAGIGITPMRALLESLPQAPGDVMIVNRVRSEHEAILAREIDYLTGELGAEHHLLIGRRIHDRASWLPEAAAGWDDTQALLEICPDVAHRDVYVCGPPAWVSAFNKAAKHAGVPATNIHVELFEL